jgi:hypothetical protein
LQREALTVCPLQDYHGIGAGRARIPPV